MKLRIIGLFFVVFFLVGCSSSGELQKSPCACGDKQVNPGLKSVSNDLIPRIYKKVV